MACTQAFYPLDKLKGNKIEKPWNSSEHQRIMLREIEGADWEPRKQFRSSLNPLDGLTEKMVKRSN